MVKTESNAFDRQQLCCMWNKHCFCIWKYNNCCRKKVIFSFQCLLSDLVDRTQNTAAPFFGQKNVIWTNKLWRRVYFKRNIKGPKNSQLNFPTKSYCCKLWFPRERHQRAAFSCHSLLRTESLVRQCHDPTLQASVSTHNQPRGVGYTVWTWSPYSVRHHGTK